jgi:hypothetical protein
VVDRAERGKAPGLKLNTFLWLNPTERFSQLLCEKLSVEAYLLQDLLTKFQHIHCSLNIGLVI